MEDKKKIKIYYGLLITLVVFMGVSYAWFRLKLTQTNSNVIGTRTCLDASLTEDTSKITLSDAFPISDEDGLKQTPFTFTLKTIVIVMLKCILRLIVSIEQVLMQHI